MKLQVLLAMALLLPAATTARGQQGQGVLMRALDEPLSLTVPDKPITLALAEVADKTGLLIRLDDGVLALLPHGEETRLRVTARNVKLGEVLSAMLAPMCLQWRVEGAEVVVTAGAALRRIGRRPTFTEVEILATLRREKLAPGADVIEQIRRQTEMKSLTLVWRDVDPATKEQALAEAAKRLPCTGEAYLDALCRGRGLTWYLWGADLTILPAEAQVRRQLQRTATVRYEAAPLQTVIADLAAKADVRLTWEPGALSTLDEETRRRFTLSMSAVTIAEALDAVSGATGLVFEPDGAALRVRAAAAPSAPKSKRRRAAFLVSMKYAAPDGREYVVLFRPEELPPEMVEAITKQKAEYLQRLRESFQVVPPLSEPAPAAPTGR